MSPYGLSGLISDPVDVRKVPLPEVRQRHSLKELGHRLPGFSISPYFFAPDGGADI
jgi:hypothetical protein